MKYYFLIFSVLKSNFHQFSVLQLLIFLIVAVLESSFHQFSVLELLCIFLIFSVLEFNFDQFSVLISLFFWEFSGDLCFLLHTVNADLQFYALIHSETNLEINSNFYKSKRNPFKDSNFFNSQDSAEEKEDKIGRFQERIM